MALARPEVHSVVVTTLGGATVESVMSGRVDRTVMLRVIADYERLGATPVWLISAADVQGYTADALQTAIREFARLSSEHGLRRIVAMISSPPIRMAAAVAAMSLKAARARVNIEVVGTRAEAVAALQLPLSET